MEEKSIEELMELIQDNNPEALYEISFRFYNGNGVDKDDKKSFDYMLKSAQLGNVKAQFWVGYKYFHEEGTEFNDKDMIFWLNKATEQNNDMAQWLLGIIYLEGEENGVDIKQNIELGMQLLEKSAKNGNKYAIEKLNQLKNIKTTTYIEDSRLQEIIEEMVNQNKDISNNDTQFFYTTIFIIIKKIIKMPNENETSIAELINYNPEIEFVEPMKQGQLSYMVEEICHKININYINTDDSIGGLAFYTKFKKGDN